jgi:hypothetical protein
VSGDFFDFVYKDRVIRKDNLYHVRFIMEKIYRVHKINPVGMAKGEVPPLKNYLWKIA